MPRISRRFLGRRTTTYLGRWMRVLVGQASFRRSKASDEELPRVCYVDADIAVHAMLGEEIDAKFLPSLGETPLTVQRDNIGENLTSFVIVHQVQKLKRQIGGRRRKATVDGRSVVVVYSGVLMMQGAIENPTSQRPRREHSGDERLKLYVAMIELVGDGALKLYLVGLEAADMSGG